MLVLLMQYRCNDIVIQLIESIYEALKTTNSNCWNIYFVFYSRNRTVFIVCQTNAWFILHQRGSRVIDVIIWTSSVAYIWLAVLCALSSLVWNLETVQVTFSLLKLQPHLLKEDKKWLINHYDNNLSIYLSLSISLSHSPLHC